MNRLILVGNGFDLAHNLKTSYRDFIDDFWRKKCLEFTDFRKNKTRDNYTDNLITIHNCNRLPKNINCTDHETLKQQLSYYFSQLNYENSFLKLITEKCYENWVDIEEEYYKQLKEAKFPDVLLLPKKVDKIQKINQDFEVVKNLLIEYLNEIKKADSIDGNICDKIYSYFKLQEFSLEAINKKIKIEVEKRKNNIEAVENKNFSINDVSGDELERKIISSLIGGNKESGIRALIESEKTNLLERFEMLPKEILILNFNYTDTPINYITNQRCNRKNIFINFNNIHGNLIEVKQNPIIFGFGDDVDEKYKEFENLNDNRFMTYFKSIAYTQTDHYKRLLEFLESDDYQVFIFGHSCGISDRTMLNTIFEHDNCKSIKPFYHKRENGSDNYTDIVQNISRNFNNKKKFRDRVVNKTYCEPLT